MLEQREPELTGAPWPALPFAAWSDTQYTLHMWTQIVGKVKLELTPFLNQWWNVTFTVTPRGMTTGPIPAGSRIFSIDFDFIDHGLAIQTNDGATRGMPLIPRSVADFYHELMAVLRDLDIAVEINPMPTEIVDPIRCDLDHVNKSYDSEAVQRWWRVLAQADKVLQRFRTPFIGKSSPVHFFWGSFDLSHTRFTGRPASLPAGAPRFMQLAENQENYACGFWPGNANYAGRTLGEPAFYAYIFPEPDGFATAAVKPAEAYYHPDFGQFLLPYETVRQSADPGRAVLDFFQSTYEAAADQAGWDRAALEQTYDH